MKLVCINVKDYYNLTLGKCYELIYPKTDNYWLVDDFGNVRGFVKDCFITLEEYRNQKIESIL